MLVIFIVIKLYVLLEFIYVKQDGAKVLSGILCNVMYE